MEETVQKDKEGIRGKDIIRFGIFAFAAVRLLSGDPTAVEPIVEYFTV